MKKFLKSPYGLIILISWIALIICLIVKLFGGNWFELWLENDNFIKFCEIIEQNEIIKKILYCLIAIFTTYPALCVFINKKYLNLKETLLFVSLIILKSIIGWYINGITFLFDLLTLIIIPLILTKFKFWKRILIGNLLVFAFQILTVVIRNLNPNIAIENSIVEILLYQIDYYLMITLFYLYNCQILNLKRKE